MVNIKRWMDERLELILETKIKVQREVKFPEVRDIKAIVGPRRSGKTFYLYQMAQKMEREKQIVYINFDDIALYNLSPSDWMKLFKTLDKGTVLLLDEVQSLHNWGRVLRSLHDSLKFDIFVTGSSSKLLIKEISSQLRGRYISKMFLPFSFREFLKAREMNIKEAFEEYLKYGGFPEVVMSDGAEKREKLLSILESTFYRDFVERTGVREEIVGRILMEKLISSTSYLFSISKTKRQLDSLGIRLSKRTVWKYVNGLIEAFMVFLSTPYVFSKQKEFQMQKKIYASDTGIANLIKKIPTGAIIETAVALELLRRGEELRYLPLDKREIDFSLIRGNKARIIEVCVEEDEEHLRKLEEGKKKLSKIFNVKEELLTLESYERGKDIIKWFLRKR